MVNGGSVVRDDPELSFCAHDAQAGLAQPDLGPISPELALVDPELAARARALLTDPLPPPRIEVHAPSAARRGPLVAAAAAAATLLAALGGAAVVSERAPAPAERTAADAALRPPLGASAPLAGLHTERARPPSGPVKRRQARTPAKKRPSTPRPTTHAAAPRVSKPSRSTAPRVAKPPRPAVLPSDEPPTLTWKDTSAPYYDFVLWRGRERILDLWPGAAHVTLPRQWTYAGHGYRLAPGRYLWFVYPGIGERKNASYGPLVTSGTFVVSDDG